jgi:hypothetical protein
MKHETPESIKARMSARQFGEPEPEPILEDVVFSHGENVRDQQETSLEAYAEQIASGKLNENCIEIFLFMENYIREPATHMEIATLMNRRDRSVVSNRVNDLVKRGFAIDVDTRPCKITGKTVLTWRTCFIPGGCEELKKKFVWSVGGKAFYTRAEAIAESKKTGIEVLDLIERGTRHNRKLTRSARMKADLKDKIDFDFIVACLRRRLEDDRPQH